MILIYPTWSPENLVAFLTKKECREVALSTVSLSSATQAFARILTYINNNQKNILLYLHDSLKVKLKSRRFVDSSFSQHPLLSCPFFWKKRECNWCLWAAAIHAAQKASLLAFHARGLSSNPASRFSPRHSVHHTSPPAVFSYIPIVSLWPCSLFDLPYLSALLHTYHLKVVQIAQPHNENKTTHYWGYAVLLHVNG